MNYYQTPSGLKIGQFYQKPLFISMDRDAMRLQESLLEPRTMHPVPLTRRALAWLVRWL